MTLAELLAGALEEAALLRTEEAELLEAGAELEGATELEEAMELEAIFELLEAGAELEVAATLEVGFEEEDLTEPLAEEAGNALLLLALEEPVAEEGAELKVEAEG